MDKNVSVHNSSTQALTRKIIIIAEVQPSVMATVETTTTNDKAVLRSGDVKNGTSHQLLLSLGSCTSTILVM